ncbi:hypothetical protein ACN6LA_000813 [Streptomyces sp. SAS_269]|uniref:hypothetical protein n=1 Tax=Streptomyces sp. SAS_269 TaxID=3412749 RepID=UPI00403CDAC0
MSTPTPDPPHTDPHSDRAATNEDLLTPLEQPPHEQDVNDADRACDREMPPNVTDRRHNDVIQAASEGRRDEAAAQLAAIGEREDITTHDINSDQVLAVARTRQPRATRIRAQGALFGPAAVRGGCGPYPLTER